MQYLLMCVNTEMRFLFFRLLNILSSMSDDEREERTLLCLGLGFCFILLLPLNDITPQDNSSKLLFYLQI